MLDLIWFKLLELAKRSAEEERGLVLIEWLVIASAMAIVAAAVVLLLKGAIEHAAHSIVTALGGS
jgi:Flp pilus assembly pilin Flp